MIPNLYRNLLDFDKIGKDMDINIFDAVHTKGHSLVRVEWMRKGKIYYSTFEEQNGNNQTKKTS